MKFLDTARIFVKSGSGGPGAISFRRERNVEFGGPDGGDGGRGGDVSAEAVNNLNTLIDFRYNPHFKAENGHPGRGRCRSGASGASVRLCVPLGTEICDRDGLFVIADLVGAGQTTLLAKGGKGGFGNHRFRSAVNQAPRRAGSGECGIERELVLRLKLIADAGLVGMPNAGKSTFLSVCTAARPKIADYPFTTLRPNIGVAQVGGKELVIADVPGLIEGAHLGRGLGIQFLRHVERCKVLLHLVDATAGSVVDDWNTVEQEIQAHDSPLAGKHRVVALSKIDALATGEAERLVEELRTASNCDVLMLSSVSGAGVEQCLRALLRNLDQTEQEDRISRPWTP